MGVSRGVVGMLTDQELSRKTEEKKVTANVIDSMSSSDERNSRSGGVTEEDATSSDAGDSSKDDADEAVLDRLSPDQQNKDNATQFTNAAADAADGLAGASNPISGAAKSIPAPNLSTSSSSTRNLPSTRQRGRVPSYESIEGKPKVSSAQEGLMQGYAASASSTSSSASTSAASAPPNVIMTATERQSSSHKTTSSNSSSKKGSRLRRGKWTVEEEAYVARVIQDFNSGFLDAPAGTTLRTYLSEKLQCDPMRITKKFTGDACIGKRVFHQRNYS